MTVKTILIEKVDFLFGTKSVQIGPETTVYQQQWRSCIRKGMHAACGAGLFSCYSNFQVWLNVNFGIFCQKCLSHCTESVQQARHFDATKGYCFVALTHCDKQVSSENAKKEQFAKIENHCTKIIRLGTLYSKYLYPFWPKGTMMQRCGHSSKSRRPDGGEPAGRKSGLTGCP